MDGGQEGAVHVVPGAMGQNDCRRIVRRTYLRERDDSRDTAAAFEYDLVLLKTGHRR
jgi:hypothetical protein